MYLCAACLGACVFAEARCARVTSATQRAALNAAVHNGSNVVEGGRGDGERERERGRNCSWDTPAPCTRVLQRLVFVNVCVCDKTTQRNVSSARCVFARGVRVSQCLCFRARDVAHGLIRRPGACVQTRTLLVRTANTLVAVVREDPEAFTSPHASPCIVELCTRAVSSDWSPCVMRPSPQSRATLRAEERLLSTPPPQAHVKVEALCARQPHLAAMVASEIEKAGYLSC